MGLAVSTCPPEPAPQIALLGCDWGLDGSGGSGVCPQVWVMEWGSCGAALSKL